MARTYTQRTEISIADYRTIFARMFALLDGATHMTRIASWYGEGGSGFDATGGDDPSGPRAFGVWRWDPVDPDLPSVYVFLTWADASSSTSDLETGAANNTVGAFIGFALDTSGGNPWQGTTDNDGADTDPAYGASPDPRWAADGGTLIVWPARNNSRTDKDGLCALHDDTNGSAVGVFWAACDETGLVWVHEDRTTPAAPYVDNFGMFCRVYPFDVDATNPAPWFCTSGNYFNNIDPYDTSGPLARQDLDVKSGSGNADGGYPDPSDRGTLLACRVTGGAFVGDAFVSDVHGADAWQGLLAQLWISDTEKGPVGVVDGDWLAYCYDLDAFDYDSTNGAIVLGSQGATAKDRVMVPHDPAQSPSDESFTAADRTLLMPGTPAPPPPVPSDAADVTLVTPGAASPRQPIELDVELGRDVIITATLDGWPELVWDGSAFRGRYAANSSRTVGAAQRFAIRPNQAWPGTVATIEIRSLATTEQSVPA